MDELKAKILEVIRRVGDTDMTAGIVIDLVLQWRAKRGGRHPGSQARQIELHEVGKPVCKPLPVGSDPDLVRSDQGSPDPSKPDPKITNIMGRRRGAAPDGDNLFGSTLARFCALWRQRYGVDYVPTAADRNQLGRLLHGLPPEHARELPDAFKNYLRDLSPFVAQEMRHCLRHFCAAGGFNKYRSAAPVLTEREARTVAAGDQWLELQRGRGG